jgi:hypothetical protein
LVSYETASRNGEPFEAMIQKIGIPFQFAPSCSNQLKTEAIKDYLKSLGWKKYHTALGIRFDEPKINPLVSFSPSIEPALLSQENKQPDLLSSIEEIAQPAEIQQEAPLLYEEGEDQQITQPAEIQQEASLLYEEGEDQQIAPSIVEANDAIKMVQDAMKKTEEFKNSAKVQI